MKRFGELLREVREVRGWQQQELARRVNKSDAYISLIENTQSGVLPSLEFGNKIIAALRPNASTRIKLKKALERDIYEPRSSRVYDSSEELEKLFTKSSLTVAEVASKLSEGNPEGRSRQTVQAWKNGRLLPPHEAVDKLLAVFRNAGIPETDLADYRRRRLFDLIFFDKLFEKLTENQRKKIADYVVEVIETDLPPRRQLQR